MKSEPLSKSSTHITHSDKPDQNTKNHHQPPQVAHISFLMKQQSSDPASSQKPMGQPTPFQHPSSTPFQVNQSQHQPVYLQANQNPVFQQSSESPILAAHPPTNPTEASYAADPMHQQAYASSQQQQHTASPYFHPAQPSYSPGHFYQPLYPTSPPQQYYMPPPMMQYPNPAYHHMPLNNPSMPYAPQPHPMYHPNPYGAPPSTHHFYPTTPHPSYHSQQNAQSDFNTVQHNQGLLYAQHPLLQNNHIAGNNASHVQPLMGMMYPQQVAFENQQQTAMAPSPQPKAETPPTSQTFATPRLSSVSTSLDQQTLGVAEQQVSQKTDKTTVSAATPLLRGHLKEYSQPHDQQNMRKSMMSKQEHCKITLKVVCMTNLSQRVAIVGNATALGGWDVSKAFLMATDRDRYPVWTAQFEVDDSRQPCLEYKFIKLTTDVNDSISAEWEQLGENRKIDIMQKSSVVVDDVFGDGTKHNEAFVKREKPVVQTSSIKQQSASQAMAAQRTPEIIKTTQIHQESRPKISISKVDSESPEEQKAHRPQPKKEEGAQTPQVAPGVQQKPTAAIEKLEVVTQDTVLSNLESRQLLKQQLGTAFPMEIKEINKQKLERKRKNKRGLDSDTTSNASGTVGSRASIGAHRRKSLLIAKKHERKTVKLDPTECMIQVTHQLPYRLVSKAVGEFTVEPSYQSPALLYANLDELAQSKTYNFVWVGIVVTQHPMTAHEEEIANKMLAEKNCYAIYYTEEAIVPYLRFYEGLVRPNMHNFVDPGDHLKAAINDWAEFKAVNGRVARRVHQVRQQLNSKTIWIHGDQFMLVPYYTRQSEKIKANIGFYFHQAFPASAVFQSFYKREELLQSLLHSDLIGFHIWEYARNFINSCQRLLGLYYELGVGNTLSVNYNKRSVQVRIWHIGLDESFVEKIMDEPKYEAARLKVMNTVKNAVVREERNIRASLSRGNLNNLQSNLRQAASQPALIGGGLNSKRYTNSITSTLASSHGDDSSQGLNDSINGKTILASIDSFHQMTGLILKLRGYQSFLRQNPEYKDKVVLFQVIRGLFFKSDNMHGQHNVEERKQDQGRSKADKSTIWLFEHCESLKGLNTVIISLVQSIRNEFGRQCLIVESGNWTIQQRLALWSKAHVLFVSTLKDGLYLTCFEYIHVKMLCNELHNSAMILSEFTGCNSQFAGFYDFNPFQLKTTVQVLLKVLQDSPEVKADRMRRAFQYCRQRTFRAWVENFLKELKLAYDPQPSDNTRILYQGLQAVQLGKSSKENENHRKNLEKNQMPVPMDIRKQALQAVSQRKNLIMIDHEALPFKQLGRSDMCPRTQIILWIQEILYDKNNIVVIMSDRDRNYVQSVFDSNLTEQENFWVAAESGYWLMTNKKQWTELFKVQNKLWMQTIRQIMTTYCENIDGAVVEERSCTVVWNYKNAEEEHGSKFANELTQHLQQLLGRHSPIEIFHGNGFIEVCPKKLSKQAVLKNILQNLQAYCNVQIESLLYIGADLQNNNSTFDYLSKRIIDDRNKSVDPHQASDSSDLHSPLFAANCKTSLCILGNRPSAAQYYLEQKDVQFLLQEMAFKTQSRKRNRSMTNLIDTAARSQNGQDGEGAYLPIQTNNDEFDLDGFDSHSGGLKKTPPRKSRIKNRHFSVTCLLNHRRITEEKTELYQPEDPITETNEEDNMTQLSEYHQMEKDSLAKVVDQLSGYDGSGSVNKNQSTEHINHNSHKNLMKDLSALGELQTDLRTRFFSMSKGAHESLAEDQVGILRIGSETMPDNVLVEPHMSPIVTNKHQPLLKSKTQKAAQNKAHESASMPQLQKGQTKLVVTPQQTPKRSSEDHRNFQPVVNSQGSGSGNGSGPKIANLNTGDILVGNVDSGSSSNHGRDVKIAATGEEQKVQAFFNRPDTPTYMPSKKDLEDSESN